MSDDKPLHVRVAEALGWTHIDNILGGNLWRGIPPGIAFQEDENGDYPFKPITRYDTDWSAMGPLIEKYGINLSFNGKHWFADCVRDEYASCHHIGPGSGFAPCADQSEHPLVSVCLCILALKESRKLQ